MTLVTPVGQTKNTIAFLLSQVTPAASRVLQSSLLASSLGLLKGPQHQPEACRRPLQPQAAPQGGSGPAASVPPHSLCYP